MVVLLREAGVPARLVEGFTTGTYDSASKLLRGQRAGRARVGRGLLPQYGWIEFEPTPSQPQFPRVDAAVASGSGSDVGSAGGDTNSDPNAVDRLNRAEDQLTKTTAPVPLTATAWWPRCARSIPARHSPSSASSFFFSSSRSSGSTCASGVGPIESAWGKTRLLASYVGHPPHPSQTTYEFANSLGAAIPETREPVRSLAQARVVERYSAEGADDDLRDAAETAWHQAASAMISLLPGRLLRFITHFWR